MADEEVAARLSLKDRRQFSREAEAAARDVRGIGRAADSANSRSRVLTTGLAGLRKGFGAVTKVAKIGAIAIAAVGAAAVAAGAKFIGLASDAGETASKFQTVFGDLSGEVSKFVTETQRAFGIPTVELQNATSEFGVFAKAAGIANDRIAGFSVDMTQAGLDLASFYNQDPSEVFRALQSGLAGQSEPLRRFGIFLSETAVKAAAAEQGLTGDLTDQQKVAVRQKLILQSLGDAQGDLARTSGSFANQMRGLKGRIQEAGTAIGQSMLPQAEKFIVVLNERMAPAVAWLQDRLPGYVDTAVESLEKLFGIARRGFNFEPWHTGMSELEIRTYRVGQAIGALARGDMRTFTQALGGAIVPGVNLIPILDKIEQVGRDLWTIISVGIVPAFRDVSQVVPDVLQPLKLLDDTLGFVADNAELIRPLIVGLTVAWIAHRASILVVTAAEKAHAAAMFVTSGRLKAAITQQALYKVGAFALRGVTLAWTAAQWLLNVAMSANPIGLVVLGIVALVAIFILAWKHSETFRNIVTAGFNAVLGVITGVWGWVSTNWPLLLAIITGPIGLAVRYVIQNFETIKETAGKVFGALQDIMLAPIRTFIAAWNMLDVAIGPIGIPSWVPGPLGGKKFHISDVFPDIPFRLHEGGTTTSGGSAIVQRDEEVVILPPAATVVPLAEGQVPVSAATGTDRPRIVQIVLDRRVLAEAVIDDVQDQAARK